MCMSQHGRQELKAHELITLVSFEAGMLAALLLQQIPDSRAGTGACLELHTLHFTGAGC